MNNWSDEMIDKLVIYLETGEIEEWLYEYNRLLSSIDDVHRKYIEYYYKIALSILTYGDIVGYWNFDNNRQKNFLMNISSHSNFKQSFIFLQQIVKSIYDYQKDKTRKSDRQTIDFIKDYIEDNIDGDLSITTLANIIHYNASYLSRLFHQKTNISISDYIKQLRISKACELLRNTNLKIGEVSQAIGFSAPSYFNRFFKKHKGVSPNEYRHNVHSA